MIAPGNQDQFLRVRDRMNQLLQLRRRPELLLNITETHHNRELGELIGEIYRSGAELLGQDRSNQLYRRAYQSILRKSEAIMQQPAVLAVLPRVA